ncbi:hypothetical protein ACFVZ3_08200 [Kitasatospora purpeofusca]
MSLPIDPNVPPADTKAAEPDEQQGRRLEQLRDMVIEGLRVVVEILRLIP